MDTGYIDKMKDAICDFRDNHIPGKKVHGVFLTGGASRMNFIRPIIAECFSLPIDNVKIDGDNPSVTISRGIAMLGAADVITTIMVTELKKQIPSLINKDEIVSGLTSQLADSTAVEAWKAVETSCDDWIRNGKTTDMDELKAKLEKDIKTFASNKVSGIVNKDLQSYISNHSEEIRKKINSIISLYAPGQEISKFGSVEISDVSAINESLKDMSKTITDICDSISHVIGDILWAAFAVFMFGIFAAPYYIGKAIWLKFRDDSAKRKDKAERILNLNYSY